MNKDEKLLAEAYLKIFESKPDYLDVDKDGDKDESMKKAFKDKEEVEEAVPVPTADNYDSPEMTQKVLDTMEGLRTKDPEAFNALLAQLLKIANHPGDQAKDEYEHKGWPGDGSGEDDFQDYNQNEGNDY